MNDYLIHVEQVWDDNVWGNLLKFIEDKFGYNKYHLFLMSPQFEYQKSVLGYRGTELELNKVLKQRYDKLKSLQKKYGFKIGMHVHICLNPVELSEPEKNILFLNSYKFLKDNLDNLDGVSFGWFKCDSYLEELCKISNLSIFHSGISFHDYDLPISRFKLFEYWMRDKLRRLFR